MRSIRDLALHNQTVFLRADLNVPLDKQQHITDDARIKAVLPTIEYIIQKGGKIVLTSHLGRPKGKIVPTLRMEPVAKRLKELLGQEIVYVDDCVGDMVKMAKEKLESGDVMLLENLRFYSQEEENDLHFAEQLVEGIDVYVSDAFGTIHRKHASTHALPSLIFDKGIGFLIEKEIEALDKIKKNPEQPLVLVIGGVKISDKVEIIRNLAPFCDVILVGGGVANTFLKGLGYDVGKSVVESDSVSKDQETVNYVEIAHELYDRFDAEKPTIHAKLPDGSLLHKIQLPLDVLAAPTMAPDAPVQMIDIVQGMNAHELMFLDIGPKTRELYCNVLRNAKTIFWNGPMGLFEVEAHAAGSRDVAETIADSSGYAVTGGGDTESVVKKFGLKGRFSHASTGGGASLKYLGSKKLPGLEALE
ncbi:MAG TPA: phosphoglycerate kinase [Patescibacteria group bacterium]|nr:phosphoglycerate kinase [Patescibacteria group bacterium]